MADEDTPVEDIEHTEDSEGAGDSGDTPSEDIPADGPSENAAVSEIKPSAERAKVAALVAGAMLAGAAAIVGAVWAIAAITDDDYDDYAVDFGVDFAVPYYGEGYYPYYGEGYYEESVAPEWSRRDEFGRERRADRDQRWRFDRDRSERFDRGSGKRTDRDKYERKGGDRQDSSEGSEPSSPAAEECWTIHRFGSGENAVTILVCKAPGAEWPEFEPGDEGGYSRFRKLPKDAFPFFGMGGDQWPFLGHQRPFGPGPMPWDRGGGPFEDGWPFRDGRPREGEPPFDLEEFFGGERFGDDGVPFDLEEFFGEGVPFDLEELLEERPDEERAQLEQMLEMLENFGLEGFLGGLLDFLEELEPGFTETPTDPAGATSA